MEKKESAKERILRVADQLFYREGIRAVGIDRIIEESGVAKASFYRSYATKDDLVVAYLNHRLDRVNNTIDRIRREHPDSARDRLHAIVDLQAETMNKPDYRGCPFMNAVVEFPEANHPGHDSAVGCRTTMWREVEELLQEAGIDDSKPLVDQLRMLWSGASMVAYINKADFRPELFSEAAKTLIDSSLAK